MTSNKDYYSNLKLLKHLEHLALWDKTGFTFPVLVNINPSNVCNNNCPLCTTKNKSDVMIPLADAKRIILEVKALGTKAIGYGGGGEPACNPGLEEIIRFTKINGMETALVTNGFGLSSGCIDAIAACCTWARVSLDADGPEIYKKTHGMGSRAFDQVVTNIRLIAEAKKRLRSELALGVTYLVGPHTVSGVYKAAQLVKELGADYIRFRPFFDWQEDDLDLSSSMLEELHLCKELVTESFDVSYPENRIKSRSGEKHKRGYGRCEIHHFVTLVDADMKVYPCCMLVGQPEYCLGDLSKQSFEDLWRSKERREAYERIKLCNCPNPCMLDSHNEFLWSLKQPIHHCNWF